MKLLVVCMLLSAVDHVTGLGRTVLSGDVFIEFIGAIYVTPGSEINGSCGNIEIETVQNIQAIKWTLSKLNEVDYIPGVKIGLRVSQTCKKEGEAERLALQLALEMASSGKDARIIGVIGSDYSSETEAISRLLSSLPEEYRLLQLGFSATSASLRNRNIYNNFFRTIPPDDIQVEVMTKFMEALNWTYMAIIHDNDAYGRGGVDEILQSIKGLDICFPVVISVDTSYTQVSQLETDIREGIFGANVPVSGILVFGSSVLADLVLTVTERVLDTIQNASRPLFLFSEAGAYVQGHHITISKGAFVLSPPRRIISKFQEEWSSIFTDTSKLYQETELNTWIRDVYQSRFNCSLAETKDNNTCTQISINEFNEGVPNSVYNQYAIQDAMVIAKVAKTIYGRKCPNHGLCEEFLDTSKTHRGEFIKELSAIREINFDGFGGFREIKEFEDPDLIVSFGNSCEINLPADFPVYEVYSHQLCPGNDETTCLVKVVDYRQSKDLQLDYTDIRDYGLNGEELLWPNIRKAQCPDGSFCSKCVDEHAEQSVLFIPGDMYIVGTVPVHNTGSTPLNCGDIKIGGLDIAETIRFAAGEAKTKPSAEIGIIIIDSCNDPQIIQEKILTLHRLGVFINGEYEFVGDKIIGYIGGWSSDVSKAVAEITSRLEYPQISYGSTAVVLSDRSVYPYFLRVPSPDDRQAETMLKIVKELGGNFIQIMYSEGAYGEGGKDILLNLIGTQKYNICVAQTIFVSSVRSRNAILQDLRRFPKAKIVVSFIASFHVNHVIRALGSLSKNEFLFITSEGWGTRFNVEDYPNIIGTITVTSQLTINEKLKDYIQVLTPDFSEVDQWIRPYMEHRFDCYFEWSYNKTSKKQCLGKTSLDVYTTDFRLDAWTPFAERAVIALLAGSEEVLRSKCNGRTSIICDSYRNSTKDVYEAIKNVKFQDNSGFSTRLFDSNGDGTAGYQIYVIALDQDGQYKKVGDSGPEVFTFQSSVYNSVRGEVVNSTCSAQIEKCNECFSYFVDKGKNGDIGLIVAVASLGVVCFILAGMLLFICYRLGCCVKIENGRPKINDTYITPTYWKRPHRRDGSEYLNPDEKYDNIQVSGEVLQNRAQSSTHSLVQTPTPDERSISGDNLERKTTHGMTGPVNVVFYANQPSSDLENTDLNTISDGNGNGSKSDELD